MITPPAIALLLALAAPAFDASLDRERLKRVAATEKLELSRGDTVFVEVRAPLRDPPDGTPAVRIFAGRQRAVSIVPWVEEVELLPERRGRAPVRTWIAVRAAPGAPLGPVVIDLRVSFLDSGERLLADLPVRWTMEIVEPRAGVDRIERERQLYLHHQTRAIEAAKLVRSLPPLLLDRVVRPRGADTLPGDEALALRAFLHARLRADVSRQRLRALATGADEAAAEAAVRAIASLHPARPRAAPPSSRKIDDPRALLEKVEAAAAELELEAAEAGAIRLHFSGAIDRAMLARILLVLGSVAAARGDETQATSDFGQASCLDPARSPPLLRPPVRRVWAEVQRRKRCTKALDEHSIVAAWRDGERGEELLIEALFGPDPYHVIERGEVSLLDASGTVIATRSVRARRGDLATVAAVFSENELPAGSDERVRVRVAAADLAGVKLSAIGDPEPRSLPIGVREDPRSGGVPWWLWVAGGVAVAGAAAAAVVLSTGADPEPGIGPVTIRF